MLPGCQLSADDSQLSQLFLLLQNQTFQQLSWHLETCYPCDVSEFNNEIFKSGEFDKELSAEKGQNKTKTEKYSLKKKSGL